MLGGNRSESGIIILYSASEQCYLVLAQYNMNYYYYYIEGAATSPVTNAPRSEIDQFIS